MHKKAIANRFANIIISFTIFLSGFVLLYGIIHYQRVLTWPFGLALTPFDGLLCFHVLPIMLISFFAFSFTLPEAYKINIALMISSVIFCLYFVEGTITFLHYTRWNFRTIGELRQDARAVTLSKIEELEQDGTQAFPAFAPSSFVARKLPENSLFPLSGISNVTSVVCSKGEGCLVYESDEHGFHNPRGLYRPGNVAIAAVGDSFTHGMSALSEENAIAFIRKIYPDTLNLGMSGNGPLAELATFREYIEPLRPKIVLWFYFSGNDLTDDLPKEKRSALRRYLDINYRQGLLERRSQIDQFLLDIWDNQKQQSAKIPQPPSSKKRGTFRDLFFLRQLRLLLHFTFIPPQLQKTSLPPLSPSEDDYKLFENILNLTKETVSSWRGELYFVYLPEYHFFTKREGERQHLKKDYERVLSFLHHLDIPTIDIYEAFSLHPHPKSLFLFGRSNHYNQYGYRLVAETILKRLQQAKNRSNTLLSQ